MRHTLHPRNGKLTKGSSQEPRGFMKRAEMSIRIDNERQLETAQDFVKFISEHNKRAMAKRAINGDADDSYDLLIRQASLINTMANSLAVKQTEIGELKSELSELRAKINELEREIRVSKDLLSIARVIDDRK